MHQARTTRARVHSIPARVHAGRWVAFRKCTRALCARFPFTVRVHVVAQKRKVFHIKDAHGSALLSGCSFGWVWDVCMDVLCREEAVCDGRSVRFPFGFALGKFLMGKSLWM